MVVFGVVAGLSADLLSPALEGSLPLAPSTDLVSVLAVGAGAGLLPEFLKSVAYQPLPFN